MIAFIDDHRESHGVEPICRVLPIAPSTYHDHAAKREDPSLLSKRAQREEVLKAEVKRVFFANFSVYGVRKVWRQLEQEGFRVARCTVARLMRQLGLQGVVGGKPVRVRRSATRRRPVRWIWCSGSFKLRRRISSGFLISLMWQPGAGSFMWPLSS